MPTAPPPQTPRVNPWTVTVALARFPVDLLVAAHYAVRELPPLLQDVRSTVNDLADMLREADDDLLARVLTGLAREVEADGAYAPADGRRAGAPRKG